MTAQTTVALDAMGGDFGPSVVVPAALGALRQDADLRLILVGDRREIGAELEGAPAPLRARLDVRHASQRVDMADTLAVAMRSKKDSSMRVAINLVKDGTAGACVSAGNTAALLAIARFVLKTLPGIDRPAIITAIPTAEGHTHMLDLGANVDCSAQHLYEFAVMGAELVTAVDGDEHPRVGLLNIGEEAIKGNEQVKEAASLLAASALNYVGYVEGDDIYKGAADVVVTDGFVGNVSLKTSEGVAKLLMQHLRDGFQRNWFTRLAGLMALPVLKGLRARFDPRHYNGASLLGLRGIVIKSHGSADALAFTNAIRIARLEVDQAVPQRIGTRVHSSLAERRAV